ncbi:UNVERIFIED_CONTAM: putative E3 ubiquitin-protein ligase [Sesamum radiatum]|uniref:E3 ubiquitin-protein ligase n=1 Tax=Sesamum radiatum TaxID=300843 RepID=A0AAW2K7S8_SESRA
MEKYTLADCIGDATSNGNSSISAQPQLRTEPRSLESKYSVPCKPNASVAYALKCPPEASNLASNQGEDSLQSEAPNATDGPNMNLKNSVVLNRLDPGEECNNSTSNIKEKPFIAAGISHTNTEENTSRAGKLGGFSGLVLDKNLKAVAESTGLNAKNSFKIGKAVSFDVPQNDVNYNISTSSGLTSVPSSGMETNNGNSLPVVPVNSSPSLPVADTELSLSFPAKGIANPMPISYSDEAANCSFVDSSNDKSLGQWVPQDRKDEMATKMVSRVRELQNKLQECTEWTNQKVMQAARRLSKDKAELKTLRQEKEEVERLKKEKQTLEESTMKKLSKMENALCKASGQVERANAAVGRLQVENAALRREMEAAKLRAAESAASCHEVSKREKMTLVKFQSWEKQKTLFQEDLAAEKRKLRHLQQKLQQGKDVQYQAESSGVHRPQGLSRRNGGVKRERECVMCLSEEMSVVFLPCAHQVVCTTCNELHEKQGMKDCPSCRSPIGNKYSFLHHLFKTTDN